MDENKKMTLESVDGGEIPIHWGRYIGKDMKEHKTIFFGAEKAIFDDDGVFLDKKIKNIKDDISDAFSEEKDYAIGDYCIYLNGLYRFTSPKPAGPWDESAVTPVSVSQEIREVIKGVSYDTGWLALNEYITYRRVQKIVFINIALLPLEGGTAYRSAERLPPDCRPKSEVPGLQNSIPATGGPHRTYVAGFSVDANGVVKGYFNGSSTITFGTLFSFPVD